jgi:hypothetical protein
MQQPYPYTVIPATPSSSFRTTSILIPILIPRHCHSHPCATLILIKHHLILIPRHRHSSNPHPAPFLSYARAILILIHSGTTPIFIPHHHHPHLYTTSPIVIPATSLPILIHATHPLSLPSIL